MNIGVDFRLASSHGGGMKVYVQNLCRGLESALSEHNFVYLTYSQKTSSNKLLTSLFVLRELVWTQILLPFVCIVNKLDLLFFPNPPVSLLSPVKILLTIPDLSFYHDRSLPGWIRLYLHLIYKLSALKASKIITFSGNSKQDIVRILGVNQNKVEVTPLAATGEVNLLSNKGEVLQVLRKFSINSSYIMYVPGSFIERKNVRDAIFALKAMNNSTQKPYALVLVGPKSGLGYENAVRLVENLDLQDKVIFPGIVGENELSALYSGAEVFIHTSKYEGFGLTPLEAMKCGTPVIAYDNSSISEIVGNGGLLVKDLDELIAKLLAVVNDDGLRRKLVSLGKKREKDYSWETTVKLSSNVVRQLL